MIGTYGRVLRTRGVAQLVVAFLAVGTALTMTPVALVLFARDATHSFASASFVLAASVTGSIVLSPLRGRLVDRVGAGVAVARLAVPSVAADVVFILVGRAGADAIVLVLLAFVAGAVTAPVGAAVRSLWSELLPDAESVHAGYALMTVMQEVTFFAGPLLAGGLIGIWSPTVAVAVAAGLSLTGAVTFATAPSAHARAPQKPVEGRLAALASAGTRTVLATAPAFGLAIGTLDVALPAFARAHGSTAASGVLLAAFAGGIGLGGFLYGLRAWSLSPGRQFPRLCLLAAVGLAPPIAASGLGVMLALVFVAGLCFAPITTCFIAVIDDVSVPEHRTEAFTWVGSLNGVGLATGAALAGQLLAASSTRLAIAAACAATLAAYVIAAARAGTLIQSRSERGRSS